MQLNDILSMVEDQNRGRWFDLLHPVTGEPTGQSLLIAGPDSRVQADALAVMTDELAELADDDGSVSGRARADVRRRLVARCVLDWRMSDGGQPVPMTHARLMQLLSVAWVMAQADAYAANRAVYFWPAGGANAD